MIKLINIKNYTEDDYIYIGRPSEFGNPYSHSDKSQAKYVTETRNEAIEMYRKHLEENPDIIDKLIKELTESDYDKIGCWCSPKKCHGEILIEAIENRKYKSLF